MRTIASLLSPKTATISLDAAISRLDKIACSLIATLRRKYTQRYDTII